MVVKGVTRGSGSFYKGSWSKWKQFLVGIDTNNRPGELLLDVISNEEKVKWLALFITFLYDTLGMRGYKRVSGVISGLRWYMHRHMIPSEIFDDPRILAVKKGARHSLEKACFVGEDAAETRKLPAFVEMILMMRKQLYVDSGVDADGLYSKAVYLSAALSFDMGLRPGNVRKADGRDKEDHCIRAGDIVFRVQGDGGEVRIKGGQDVRCFLLKGVNGTDRVIGADVYVWTSKTFNRGQKPIF